MENKFMFYPGCLVSTKLPSFEASARKVFESFDIELIDMEGATCCPDPVSMRSIDEFSWLTIAARNLTIAEDKGLDIITLCSGCFETFNTAIHLLKDKTKREEINKILSKVGREYKGTVKVKHGVQFFYDDIGIENIKNKIIKQMKNLNIAPFAGCHINRPSDICNFGNPLLSEFLEELIDATGAESIDFRNRIHCCGMTIRGENEEISLKLVENNLIEFRDENVDAIIVVCPTCFLQFDLGQLLLKRKGKEFNIPVLYYFELLALALGYKPDEIGLNLHKIKLGSFLEKL